MTKEDDADKTLINTKTHKKLRTSKLRKGLISLFIVFVLGMQVRANVLPPLVNASAVVTSGSAATPRTANPTSAFDARWRYVVWQLDRLSWFLGLATHWRMFAPPPKSHWYYSVWAVMEDGSQKWIQLENQGERSWPQRQFFDFREVKFHLNIYNREEPLNAFAQHLCRKQTNKGWKLRSVRIAMISRPVLSPREAFRQGKYYGPETVTDFGTYQCREKAIN
ncbi:MAG: hypothetical protein KDD66_02510 [Bdellovibrionales bacterium]|nr:hypothetical protein [Bdellovibrionales bacterium]